jgi:uncharacterized membrane protein YgcG
MRRHEWFRVVQPPSHRAGALNPRTPNGHPLVAVLTLALGLLVSWGGVASAAQTGTCSANGCIIDMAPPIYVMNNQWGNNGYGSGSITVSSPTAWSTSWDFAPGTDWNVISYPAAILGWQWGYRLPNSGFPVQLSSHAPINTTVAFNYVPDVTCAPGGMGGGGTGTRVCRLDVSYDLWLHASSDVGTSDPAYEVMIWLAYSRELFSGTPAMAYAFLGGHRWKVIQTQGGSSPVATFLLDEPDLTGAILNMTDFTDWLVANGWVSATWWIDSVQFGTEIFNGKGTLNMTYYSAAVGTGGGGSGGGGGTDGGSGGGGSGGGGGTGGFGLVLSRSSFTTGETATVTLHAPNPALTSSVDVYFGALLPPAAGPSLGCPAGDAIAFLTAGFTGVAVACRSSAPAGFHPLAQNVSPAALQDFSWSFVWPTGLPPGSYTFFLGLTRPGAFADGSIDPGDVLALTSSAVSLSP